MPFDLAPATGAAGPGTTRPAPPDATTQMFGADGLTFDDVLDVINPLHHIPVVSTIYRELSGDRIAAGPRIAGGGLFGGIFGLFAAVASVAIEHETGNDIGGHVMALLNGGDAADPPIQTAALAPTTLGAASGSTNPGKAAAAYTRMAEAIEIEVNRDGGP